MRRSFRVVHSEWGFTLSIAAAFCIAAQVAAPSATIWLGAQYAEYLQLLVAWSALSAVLSLWLLGRLDYFEACSPLPHRSDILTLMLTLPLPAAIVKYAIVLITGEPILRYREVLAIAPFVALIGFLYQYAAGLLFIRRGACRVIRPILLPAETELLQAEFWRYGVERFFRWSEVLEPDLIVISRAAAGDFQEHKHILEKHLRGTPVVDIGIVLTELRRRISLDQTDLWSYLLTATRQTASHQLYSHLKTVLEPLLALILLILLSPLALVIAIAIRCTSPGPALFRQRRTGARQEDFMLFKFRSMRVDAEAKGPAWAKAQGDMITPLGRWLRKSHLDEIPQLWNVLRGEMSFVGPRPERPEYYALLSMQIPMFSLRTLVRPGITGWAQVTGGYAASVEESREKLEYDLYYIQHMSPRLDAIVILKTILLAAFLGDGERRSPTSLPVDPKIAR